jgi:ABC-type uncharacterized transport system involved in gliding motility auxiliary subunit
MNSNWMKTRQTKFSAYVSTYIAIVIALLGGLNFLAQRHNKSVDLTSNKRYSLSDQTEKIVKNLKQDVKVTVFDRTDAFGKAKDLLDRYNNLSTKLQVEYIDPYKKPTIARAAGVKTEGQIFVESGTKHEEARSLSEEEVTGAIIRSIKSGDRSMCSVSGSGEHTLDESGRKGYSGAKEALEKNNYKTRAISLLEKPEVPKDCTVLLVAGPRFDYLEPAVNAIKTYVEAGGHAMFFIDPPLKMGKEDIADNSALLKVIEAWGITLNKDLALDTSGIGQIFGLGPEVPLVTTYASHAIVREMKEVATAFPLARTIEVKSGDKGSAEKLFSSSANSYATANLSSGEIQINPAKDKKGPLDLGAAATINTSDKNNPGRVVVVGSSDWASNGFLRFNGNRDMFLNMVNWLSADEDLISIRPKDPEDQRLSMTKSQMGMVMYTSIVFIPGLIILAGISIWWRRR